jgi:hypothetical protein
LTCNGKEDDYLSWRNEHFAELRQWIVKRDRKLDGCDAGNGHALMTWRLPRRSKIWSTPGTLCASTAPDLMVLRLHLGRRRRPIRT